MSQHKNYVCFLTRSSTAGNAIKQDPSQTVYFSSDRG